MAKETLIQKKQQKAVVANDVAIKRTALEKLDPFGGFDIIGTTITGADNMNPARESRKSIFLNEKSKEKERNQLLTRLQLWKSLLEAHGDIIEMSSDCREKAENASTLLDKNLKSALDTTKDLESSYRAMAAFYKNTAKDKIKNITIMNASPEQISDLDNPTFFDKVFVELRDKFDRLDLMNNYSLMVIPGYMGSKKVIDKWARLAHDNKVLLITDYRHLDSPDDVMQLFEEEKLTGADAFRANVIMACNYLVGREMYPELGEKEPLFIPPSTALAGRIYDTLMSQVAAGKKYGSLYEVDGVRFDLRANEIAELEKMGLIPMVKEFGQVQALSGKTLFNGNNLGLQSYSIVRVFDWVTKSLMDYLNRMLFQNINANVKIDIRREIVRYLDSIKGSNKMIKKFQMLNFEVDKNKPDRININIHITPFFAVKNFVIKLDGSKGDDPDSPDWKAEMEEAA